MSERWLIVDDDAEFAETLAESLLKRGFEVGVAYWGSDALKSIDGNFSGVLVDLNLTDANGDEIIEQIRNRFPNIKLGLITGMPDAEIENLARRCHADFWLRKPFEIEQLINLMGIKTKQEV